jgi:hypothetical protein
MKGPLVACGAVVGVLMSGASLRAADNPVAAALGMKSESFDRDPGWEGFNNHIAQKSESAKVVKQDFGYSGTHHASKATGELGGAVQRALTTAYYAGKVSHTLDDKLSASGTFAITASTASGGVFFGWFDSRQPNATGRPTGSLGMNLDFEKKGARLAVRLITSTNQSCGTFITPFIPGKFRPTPIRNDGMRYHWTMSYDPEANHGDGQFQYSIKSDSSTPEEFEGKTFTVDLPSGYRKQGANFDRFGLANLTKAGGTAVIFFGDLTFDGKAQNFTTDPNWVGEGNRGSHETRESKGAQDFGFTQTSMAGGGTGEMGGLIWRAPYAYYADRIAPVTLQDRLEAHGRVILEVGAPDSGVMLGWFSSATKDTNDKDPLEGRSFVGVRLEGPTRIGHYFLPICHIKEGHTKSDRATPKTGPILTPGKAYEWSMIYDPKANGGRGEMRATLGEESVTYEFRKMDPHTDTTPLDRFGLFGVGTGGGQIKVYVDDLKYSVGNGEKAK